MAIVYDWYKPQNAAKRQLDKRGKTCTTHLSAHAGILRNVKGMHLVVVGKSGSMADFSFLKKKWQNSLDLLTEKVA